MHNNKKEIDKFKRSEMDRGTTSGNELTIVEWKGSKSLYVAWNCDSTAQIWNKDTKAKLQSHNLFPLTSTTMG